MPSFRINLQWAAISEVVPNLYISGITALKPVELRALGVHLIVNCTGEIPNLNCLQECHRVKLWLDDDDGADAFSHFDPVADQIEMVLRNGGKVLVHCVAGVSRSAAMCLAYLLKYHCKSLREAYWIMSTRRPMVRPNLGFWRQLIAYEQIIKKRPSSVRLVWVKTERKRRASGESVGSNCSSGSELDTESNCDSGNAQPSTGAKVAGAPSMSAISNGTIVGEESALGDGEPAGTEMMLVPDVYMPIIVPRKESPTPDVDGENHTPLGLAAMLEARERRSSGQKAKFVPILEPVVESDL